MKSATFAKLLTLLAAAAITFTPGCRRKPKGPITPLPNARLGDNGIRNPSADPSELGDTTPGLSQPSGVEGSSLSGPGSGTGQDSNIGLGSSPLDRSLYNEDRAQFAGDVVYFDFDSAVIKSSEKAKLSAIAAYLQSHAGAAVEVEGHCDERGTEEYNRSLGERRALAAREELALLGIDPRRVFTISYGEDRPAIDGHNESAWSRNRRGEFVLLNPR